MSRATTDGIAGVALAADGRLVYTSETGNATGVSSFTPR
jgi:hypothetical protein